MSVAESMRLLDDPDPGVREEARQIGRRFPEGITKAVGILIGTYDVWDPDSMEVYGPREAAQRLIEGLAKEFPDLVKPWAPELKKRYFANALLHIGEKFP